MSQVTFEGARYPVRDGENILDALMRGGARVTSSCRKGSCQSCVLRAVRGEPDSRGQAGLSEEMRAAGHFLPCISHPREDIEVERVDPTALFVRAVIADKTSLASDVVRLWIEPEVNLCWRPGQYIRVRQPGQAESRCYSIASLQDEDYFMELHVRRVHDGKWSTWLTDRTLAGDVLEIRGPLGSSVYDPADKHVPLMLVAGGTGLAPLLGIARDALARGHEAPIELYHGARTREGIYARDALSRLAEAHANFRFFAAISEEPPEPGDHGGLVTDVAFSRHKDLSGWKLFLAGTPEMVYAARARAVGLGAKPGQIQSDPFTSGRPYLPDDRKKIRGIPADPELWTALGEGRLLREILTDFYDRVYEDPRLSPFFHRVTKDRAIDKQYEFLAMILTGKTGYFGLNPFNAHHWMVISDELFDYRERLIEERIRAHGLPEHLVRRWLAIHELFRREITKEAPRGLLVDGIERDLEVETTETILVGSVCDGCGAEMPAGSLGRLRARTGELFCKACSRPTRNLSAAPPA